MDEVVGERPEPGVAEVADHRDVGDEQQRHDEQPGPALDAVQDEAGDERRDRLRGAASSGSMAPPPRRWSWSAGIALAIMAGSFERLDGAVVYGYDT